MLQQFPNVEPMQVIVVPQVPSVDIDWDAVDVELVFEEVVEVELVDAFVVEELLDVPHVPEAGWHPVPQYAVVDPHQPALEQQLPNVEPRQVMVAEHVPSVLTLCGTGALAFPERYQFTAGSPRQLPTVTDL